jgi:hypothetical protein
VTLWVDDIRRPPDDSWTWARTNDEARKFLMEGDGGDDRVYEASLDHDMGHHDRDPDDEDSVFLRGDSEDDGVQLVNWMIFQNRVPPKISIHSWNPVGARRMAQLLAEHCDDITVRPYEVQR